MPFNVIVATDLSNGIGYQGTIPWYFKSDLRYFKKCTLNSTIVMGRKTWDSLPTRPLPKRKHIVLGTKSILVDVNGKNGDNDTVTQVGSWDTIENLFKDSNETVWIIGGSSLYNLATTSDKCQYIYQTRIHDTFKCDTFFGGIPDNFELVSSETIDDIDVVTKKVVKIEYLVFKKVFEKDCKT